MRATANSGHNPLLDLFAFLITFTIALTLTLLLMPVCDRLGRRWGMTTKAGGRRMTEADFRRVSKLGGVGLALGFVVAALLAQFLPVPRFDANELTRLAGLVLGTVFLTFVGILDDKYELKALPQFLIQFAAAGIAIGFQVFIEYFNNPFTGQQTDPWHPIVTVILTAFWLVVTMNTVNFLDGLDGLAGGVAFIAGIVLFVNSVFALGQTSVGLLHLALMGASLGFVIYNFYPARIFMGSGAVTLGYILGALAIIGGAKMATILFVIALPLLDAAWQAANRLVQGRSPFRGDRGHLHFRLLDMGFSQRQIVSFYYLFCALFGVLTLVIESQFFKLLAFLALMGLVVLGFLLVERMQRQNSERAIRSE
jgi:UDP-GlcNAc:undecaprenyl-phosphate GlcNAc-1-phosphate transferase